MLTDEYESINRPVSLPLFRMALHRQPQPCSRVMIRWFLCCQRMTRKVKSVCLRSTLQPARMTPNLQLCFFRMTTMRMLNPRSVWKTCSAITHIFPPSVYHLFYLNPKVLTETVPSWSNKYSSTTHTLSYTHTYFPTPFFLIFYYVIKNTLPYTIYVLLLNVILGIFFFSLKHSPTLSPVFRYMSLVSFFSFTCQCSLTAHSLLSSRLNVDDGEQNNRGIPMIKIKLLTPTSTPCFAQNTLYCCSHPCCTISVFVSFPVFSTLIRYVPSLSGDGGMRPCFGWRAEACFDFCSYGPVFQFSTCSFLIG